MHRILAGLIAVLLAGAVGVAIVRSNEESNPAVLGPGTPAPSQTYTFSGPPPTAPLESETPIVPPSEEPAATPTKSVGALANTGGGSTAALAGLMLVMGLGGGVLVRRAARIVR